MHNFDVELTDSCTAAVLVQHDTIPVQFEVIELSQNLLSESYKAFTDSISDSNGIPNSCGVISYSLLDENDEAAPSTITVTNKDTSNADAEGNFSIIVDLA